MTYNDNFDFTFVYKLTGKLIFLYYMRILINHKMFYINCIVFAINITSRHIICFMLHALNRNNYVNQLSLPGNSPISSQKPGDQEEREDDYSEGDDDLKTGDDLEISDDLETDDDEEINDDQNTRNTCITCGTKKVYIDLNKYFKTVQRFGKIYLIKLLLFWVTTVK